MKWHHWRGVSQMKGWKIYNPPCQKVANIGWTSYCWIYSYHGFVGSVPLRISEYQFQTLINLYRIWNCFNGCYSEMGPKVNGENLTINTMPNSGSRRTTPSASAQKTWFVTAVVSEKTYLKHVGPRPTSAYQCPVWHSEKYVIILVILKQIVVSDTGQSKFRGIRKSMSLYEFLSNKL